MSKANAIEVRSGSMDEPAREAERYAHGSVEIAEACADAICEGNEIMVFRENCGSTEGLPLTPSEVADCIAKTLDAIQKAQREGTTPNS